MLTFNEGKACDAVVRHLEKRANAPRTGLRCPEDERHSFPIDLVFTIGTQLFALEHTGIEPFKGHVQMDAEASRLFKPIVEALNGALDTTATFELIIPANALSGMRMPEVRSVQKAIIGWVKVTAPTLPRRRYATSVASDTVPGVPFGISLHRFEPVLVPGHYFQIKHLVGNGEQARTERIREAVGKKFPKLAAWKRDHNARTILILENNDIQLTSPVNVTETFLPLAMARSDRPDETYLVASCMDPWHAWPILIDGRSYFDLAQEFRANVGWQIDQHALIALTKR